MRSRPICGAAASLSQQWEKSGLVLRQQEELLQLLVTIWRPDDLNNLLSGHMVEVLVLGVKDSAPDGGVSEKPRSVKTAMSP